MNNSIKNITSRITKFFGYTVVPNWQLDHYAQGEFLRRLFEYFHIDCVFDVGANEGQYGRFLRTQVGYHGLIISFEPIPECAKILRESADKDGKWLVEEIALGSEPGIARFNIMAGKQFSSFLKPDNSRAQMFSEQNQLSREIKVQVDTLEKHVLRVASEHGCSSLYLKLDTQGFDLNVARSAGSAINKFRALQTESSVIPIYEDMPGFSESIREFQEMGFELSAIFPNNPDHFPRMIEFDCHMINGNLL